MSDAPLVRREVQDHVAVVTIDRPQKLNALDRAVVAELKRQLRAAGEDPAVRAIVLTGAGAKAFVAGADIAEMAPLSPDEAAAYAREGQGVATAITGFPAASIAAVEGFALGGGCELALMCHLRVAAPSARFGQPEVALGLIPGFGGTQRLARLIGPGRALDMILTGRQVDAETALAWGLVDRIARERPALDEALALARTIAAQGPVAVRLCLDAVRRGLDRPLAQALQLEAELFGEVFATADMREGTRAFLEKRKPAFEGR